jgi:hypothetical protein
VKRTEVTPWSEHGNASVAALESFFAAAQSHQPESASNSNDARASKTVVNLAPPAETKRLLRAFNSVTDRDLRRILVDFVETAAGIGHKSARRD